MTGRRTSEIPLRKTIGLISDSEPVGWGLITASTVLVWCNCYPHAEALPAVAILVAAATLGYAIAALLKTVRIVPESATVGSIRYAFVLYMLIVNARHGVSLWWAWFISAAYLAAVIIRIIEWHRNRQPSEAQNAGVGKNS